ncbi:MAG: thiamine pyrophosphate-dependent enzyme [Planctomycetota bacterium]|nr:thiamine pyrophosphate-dependent enzyme [Planctomycetota bacterium]
MAEAAMKLKVGRPQTLRTLRTHYCAGCGHGVAHRIIAEIIDEWGLRGQTIGMAPVGCGVLMHQYIDVDMCESPHGRTPEVASGIKRARPDKLVFCYQGDGDLAAIGTNEIIHVANRGEPISVIFINNAIYGMTGGQMAPTTVPGQKTTTSPQGRSITSEGYPIRVCELLATLEKPAYLERCVIGSAKEIQRTKTAIKKSFRVQRDLKAFSLVEILSPCPTYWRVPPTKSVKYIETWMEKIFPPGVVKDTTK